MFRSLLIILLFSFASVKSQTTDFQMWYGAKASKKIIKNTKISIEEEFRFYENASQIGKYFTQLSGSYEIINDLEIGASYRFSEINSLSNGLTPEHRYILDVSYAYEIFKNFKTSLRVRYQEDFMGYRSELSQFIPDAKNRYKLSFKYAYDDFSPTAYCEIFYNLNKFEQNQIYKYRLALGSKYKINKKHRLSLLYILQQEIDISNTLKANIFVFSSSIKI